MKYFIVSDIHSFYVELKSALDKAGFNKRNKDHTLIVCGDIFDRGLCLPSDIKMTDREQDIIIKIIRECFK